MAPILPRSGRIPVTLLSACLGAGRTTAVNRPLAAAAGRRLAVPVNDFGAVSVDAALIEARDATTISLADGCLCRAVSDDLGGALDGLACPAAVADARALLGGFAPGRPGLDAAEAAATPDLLPGPLVSGATPRPLPGPAPHPAFSTRIRPLPAPAAPAIVLIAAVPAETRETALAQAIAERDAAPFPEARPGDTA
ncbi:MAG: hypothetical protein CML46_13195 [Rhodobacteraceae bacterium]|nr:hypothetical protein [Paracoccaceae bacterium]MBR27885.1 hypothetical protein [Paracoccaceae bacterium]